MTDHPKSIEVNSSSRIRKLRMFGIFLLILSFAFGLLSLMYFDLNVTAQTGLSVEILAGYNLVVDSNVQSPSTYGPSAATVAGRVCNNTGGDVDNVVLNIGNATALTPGIYPGRDSSTFNSTAGDPNYHPALINSGSYAFTHEGGRAGLSDASRPLGTLPAGECAVQYWTFSYPRCENSEEPPCSGDAVWGNSVKPEDDLWLNFDVWATGDSVTTVDESWTMHLRNEISAMANKIEPNGNPGGQWFNTDPTKITPGGVITTNGILYRIGNVRFGFDNDGDYLPDYNFWVQPIGDASQFDSGCFRLIRTSGIITVAGGTDKSFNFTDQLYFTNAPDPKYPEANRIPTDNTNVTGEVYYTFLAMGATCNAAPTPYQEAASGYDNEKFNGDFGAGGIVPVTVDEAEVTIDKNGTPGSITVGKAITYTIPFENESATESAGLILYNGATVNNPLVISDSIPAGAIYRANSADYTLSGIAVDIRFSTDGGDTWTETEPAAAGVTTIQWWLTEPLPPSASGSAIFAIDVPLAYTGTPVLENCAVAQFGTGAPFAEACETTQIEGTNSIGDFVWDDVNANGSQDGGAEVGIDAITVTLYYDADGDGALDLEKDVFIADTVTSGGGAYLFDNLADGNYLVQVNTDTSNTTLPFGYSLTTDKLIAVDLDSSHAGSAAVDYADADFGFGPALTVSKTLLTSDPALESHEVQYRIDIANVRPGDGTGIPSYCTYETWAAAPGADTGTGQSAWTNPERAFNASELDGNYALSEFSATEDVIAGTSFNLGSIPGNITKVEAVFPVWLDAAINDDEVELDLYYNSAAISNTLYNTGSGLLPEINAFVGTQADAGYLVWDVTALRSWQKSDFTGSLIELIMTARKSALGNQYLYLDALGFRITTDATCGGGVSDTLNPVPLFDTYDAALLEFVSADPAVSGNSTGGTSPYANTGSLSWSNVGPIYGGGTQSITVTFKGLDPGTGTVVVTNTATVTGAKFITGEPANPGEDDAVHNLDPTGSIGDLVWNDINGDGNQDGGAEVGLPFVQMILYDSAGTTPLMTTTTSITGYYLFEGLVTNTYVVKVTPGTILGGTGTPTYDLDGGNDNQTSVDLLLDEDRVDADFGYTVPAAIFGNVRQDWNKNSLQDPGDNGFAGATVTLAGACAPSCPSVTVDSTGAYAFTGLTGGANYGVVVTPPPGFSQTLDPDEGGVCTTCDSTKSTITVVAGQIYGAYDFAYGPAGTFSIGDTVYTDWNGDGLQSANEFGIPNLTVTLYEDVNGNGVVDAATDALITTDVTDADGVYTFSGLPAGKYLVIVDETDPDFPYAPGRFTRTEDNYGSADGKAPIDLTATVNDADFGYHPVGFGSIGDYVWKDMNANGFQNSNETGLPNITVTLYGDNGDGVFNVATDGVVSTTVTDAGGKYLFTHLISYTYFVVVDQTDPDLVIGGQTYQLTTHNSPLTVALTTGQTYLPADFGFAPPATVGDLIYQDNNKNGQWDLGEPGISGVTVELYNDVNGNGQYDPGTDTLVNTDTTDANGFYLFAGLPAGNYLINVDDTALLVGGYSRTGDPEYPAQVVEGGDYVLCGDDPDPSGIGFGGCNAQSAFSLNLGQTDLSRDFGYSPPRAIGDRIWLDTNEDGVQDDGERGIGGITVTVTVPGGGNTFTTHTDIEGYYGFGGADLDFGNGDYTITVIPGPDYALTYDYDDGTTNPDGAAVVAINSTGFFTDVIDFGLKLNGSLTLSGTVFADLGGATDTLTDTFTTGDTPYAGVTVLLYNSTRALIGSTTTDATGHYTFTGLFGSTDYTVVVQKDSAMQEQTLTARPDGTVASEFSTPADSDLSTRVTVSMGSADLTDIDFGFYADSVILSVGKSVNPTGSVAPGDTLTYTIRITNSGTLSTTTAAISDTIPANTSYVPASLSIDPPGAGSVAGQPSGGLIYINPITVEADSAVTLTYRVTVTDPLPMGVDTITNTVLMTDTTISRTDTVTNPAGSVVVQKLVDVTAAAPSQIVTYTILITNTGGVALNPVVVTDTLDAGLVYISGSANPPATTQNGQTLVWADVTSGAGLASGASTQITLRAEVTTTVGAYQNGVEVEGTTPTGTVTDTDTIPVTVADPAVEIDKQVVPPGVQNGLITFTIRMTNVGPSTLQQVPLFDNFTGPINYIGGTPIADTIDTVNQSLAWNDLTTDFGDLAPNQVINVVTVFELTASTQEFTMTNTAVVSDAIDEFGNTALDDTDSATLNNTPTAVTLLYFNAASQETSVILSWATWVETNNRGFRVLRSATNNIADATELAFIVGTGFGTAGGATYQYIDQSVMRGERYTYWLVDVDYDGFEKVHSPQGVLVDIFYRVYLPLVVRD